MAFVERLPILEVDRLSGQPLESLHVFRNMNGWIRLAIVLSGLWLVGIGLYAAFSWKNPERTPTPFVEWWWTYPAEHGYVPTLNRWFDWGTFTVRTIGVIDRIWLF